jgi:hypothetical protein
LEQLARPIRHHKTNMLSKTPFVKFYFILLISLAFSLTGCSALSPKVKDKAATLLKTENATQAQLVSVVDRFARVNSMRAKMDLKIEDNSYAEVGLAEKYKSADGEVVVQRPANILLKVQIPFIKSDLVQMASNGEKFCVALVGTQLDAKLRKFVCGTNAADYSILQEEVNNADLNGNGDNIKKNVNALSNLRPQHFTDALLVRPIDSTKFAYVQSSIVQEEEDVAKPKKSPLRKVLRGYYLLDELRKNDDGSLSIARRFWFDRVGGIRLARQQIFDDKMEIESDIVYGVEGNLGESGEYNNLPLEIVVTRPKDKYKMKLTYQTPETVSIGKTYKPDVFLLKNDKNLPEVDLDQKARELKNRTTTSENQKPNEQNK